MNLAAAVPDTVTLDALPAVLTAVGGLVVAYVAYLRSRPERVNLKLQGESVIVGAAAGFVTRIQDDNERLRAENAVMSERLRKVEARVDTLEDVGRQLERAREALQAAVQARDEAQRQVTELEERVLALEQELTLTRTQAGLPRIDRPNGT